jgi:NADPH-dependent 2,4-dienoyl-CoA reductase/sulfur reductase-like enzyme
MSGQSTTTSLDPINRVVIVGASLAGLSAAEALRNEGYTGHLTLIGDEQYEPYDRPPLSKTVLTGWLPVEHTTLPHLRDIQAEWILGVAAIGLDRQNHQVHLADGRLVDFDRLLIATGTRARPWVNQEEAGLDGMFTVRTRDDSSRLRARLASGPKRVLVIGGGFTGSEVASVCCELGLPRGVRPVPAGFPPPGHTTHSPVAASTGPGPSTPEPPIKGEAARMKDPRVPPGPPPL